MLKSTILSLSIGIFASLSFAVAPGDQAPDFKLTDQTGTEHTLSDFSGKILVLEWTNPHCPFVKDCYNRDVSKSIGEKFAGNDKVAYVLVNSTSADHENYMTADQIEEWAEGHGVKFPVLEDADGSVGRAYGAKTTPHVFIVDGEGVVRYNGAIDNNQLNRNPDNVTHYTVDAVNALLAGEEVAEAQTKPWGCGVKYGLAPKAATETSAKACCDKPDGSCCKEKEDCCGLGDGAKVAETVAAPATDAM